MVKQMPHEIILMIVILVVILTYSASIVLLPGSSKQLSIGYGNTTEGKVHFHYLAHRERQGHQMFFVKLHVYQQSHFHKRYIRISASLTSNLLIQFPEE